jgi:hypothetical protein
VSVLERIHQDVAERDLAAVAERYMLEPETSGEVLLCSVPDPWPFPANVFASGIAVDQPSLGDQGCQGDDPTSWEVCRSIAEVTEVLRYGDVLVKHGHLADERADLERDDVGCLTDGHADSGGVHQLSDRRRTEMSTAGVL